MARYVCVYPGCGASYTFPTGLRRHVVSVHSGTVHRCLRCDAVFNRRDSLVRHMAGRCRLSVPVVAGVEPVDLEVPFSASSSSVVAGVARVDQGGSDVVERVALHIPFSSPPVPVGGASGAVERLDVPLPLAAPSGVFLRDAPVFPDSVDRSSFAVGVGGASTVAVAGGVVALVGFAEGVDASVCTVADISSGPLQVATSFVGDGRRTGVGVPLVPEADAIGETPRTSRSDYPPLSPDFEVIAGSDRRLAFLYTNPGVGLGGVIDIPAILRDEFHGWEITPLRWLEYNDHDPVWSCLDCDLMFSDRFHYANHLEEYHRLPRLAAQIRLV